MPSVKGIHHVALVTPNLDQAIAFYCQALSFSLVKRSHWQVPQPLFDSLMGLKNSAADFCLLKSANCYLEIFCYDSSKHQNLPPAAADQPGIRHIALEVASIDSLLASIIEAGGSRVGQQIQVPGGGAAIYCRDPFGNIIELIEPAGTMPGLHQINP